MNWLSRVADYGLLIRISNLEAFYNDESLEKISRLIQSFDTGVTNSRAKKITLDEMGKMIPAQLMLTTRKRGDQEYENNVYSKRSR